MARAWRVGMALAFAFSARRGLLPAAEAERVAQASRRCRLADAAVRHSPASCPAPDGLLELMAQDKKVKRGKLALILARGIGKAFIEPDVDQAEIRAFLAEQLAAALTFADGFILFVHFTLSRAVFFLHSKRDGAERMLTRRTSNGSSIKEIASRRDRQPSSGDFSRGWPACCRSEG